MFDLFSMHTMQRLIVLIPALPLAAAVLTAILGPLDAKRAHWPTILALSLSAILSLLLLVGVQMNIVHGLYPRDFSEDQETTRITLWQWADVPNAIDAKVDPPDVMRVPSYAKDLVHSHFNFDIGVTLRFDPLTALMLSMVTFVSLLVAIYSVGYMRGDPGYWRFFSYVSLFVFSMTMLVSVSNFLLLYVFWEAVGMCSYLLIGFWYQKPAAAAAGKKAFLVNRIGDFGFALGIFLIWFTYGTLNFHDTTVGPTGFEVLGVLGHARLADPSLYAHGGVALAICLLLMLGACGKSAQFPLHVWLPDAMEGPTPVSALIHAATMVTAGVYMVVRCTPLFFASPEAQLIVAVIGGFTALLGAFIAVTQTDLKRILAYSTISQLGYMFLALGTGSMIGITAGMFHLLTHAFFKALLFLAAGSVMHAMGGVIDLRQIGGLRRRMPITCWTFLAGCLALSGVIPFAGFWSKDMILSAVMERAHSTTAMLPGGAAVYQWLYWIATATALLTSFYAFRAFFLAFFGRERIPPEAAHHAHESPPSMTVPLLILALFAAGIGLVIELSPGFGPLLAQTPSLSFEALKHTDPVAFHPQVALISTVVALAGVALAAFFYLGEQTQIERLAQWFWPLYRASLNKLWFDEIYGLLVVGPLRALSWFANAFDRYVIDGLVNLIGRVPGALGSELRTFQNGLLQSYALAMVIGTLVLIGTLIFFP